MTQYNRNVKFRACGVLLMAFALFSCGNKMRTREAVERGVRKGVSQRGLNVDNLDITVNSVNFHGDKADAVVGFAPKGGRLSEGLTMRYTLEQRGNEWVIVGRSQADMHSHAGASPDGASPDGASPGGNPPLPPGHPSLPGNSQPGNSQ